MKVAIVLLCVTTLISGCGEGVVSREDQKKLLQMPGYREAKIICSQCHKLPIADIHVSAAWPSVITRMEKYIKINKRRMPTEQEREAIIGYFQAPRQ